MAPSPRRAALRRTPAPAALALFAAGVAHGAVTPDLSPIWPVTFVANKSSYLYWCDWSAPLDPASVANWSIVSLDWSNQKWGPAGWAAAKPMDCEERLYSDATNIVAGSASPSTTRGWVYRESPCGRSANARRARSPQARPDCEIGSRRRQYVQSAAVVPDGAREARGRGLRAVVPALRGHAADQRLFVL